MSTFVTFLLKTALLIVQIYLCYNGDFSFLTGSMCGERIKNAKEALFLFLKSLPENCTFNVISFGSSYSSLFKLYVRYLVYYLKVVFLFYVEEMHF